MQKIPLSALWDFLLLIFKLFKDFKDLNELFRIFLGLAILAAAEHNELIKNK